MQKENLYLQPWYLQLPLAPENPDNLSFRVTNTQGRPANGGNADPLPLGLWSPRIEDAQICVRGWHTTNNPSLWKGSRVFLVEGRDRVATQDDKSCWKQIRPLAEIDPLKCTNPQVFVRCRADLTGVDLTGASLSRAYLRGANLAESSLRGANLAESSLRGADLTGAYLSGAYLRGADLRGADLRGADLREADLREADLCGADLRGADLRGADLREADLREANLRGADLTGAYLYEANLRGADLTGTNLHNAYGRDDWAELVNRGAKR